MPRPIAQLNAELAKKYGPGAVVCYRAREGYYYFGGTHPRSHQLGSIMQYRLDPEDVQPELAEVNKQLAELG